MKIKRIEEGKKEYHRFYNDEITLEYDPEKHTYAVIDKHSIIPVPSVTTVVKVIDKSQILINWAVKLTVEKLLSSISFPIDEQEFVKKVLLAKKAHRERLEDAGNVGTRSHDWIEWYIRQTLSSAKDQVSYLSDLDQDQSYDDRIKSCCSAAVGWMLKHDVRWVSTERKIYSREYMYAGTLDGIAIVSSCDNRECCPHEFKDRLSLIDWKTSNQLYQEYLFQTAAYQHAYQEETGDSIVDRWIIRLGKEDGSFEPWHLEGDFEEDFKTFLSCLNLTNSLKSVNIRLNQRKGKTNGRCFKKDNQGKESN